MKDHHAETNELIRRARQGDAESLGRLLEYFRGYLRILADRRLGGRIAARVDASDVVQQTFLEAARDFGQFHGVQEPEFAAWLVRILERNVAGVLRDHAVLQKRAVGRERSLDDSPTSGQGRVEQLAAGHSSPSMRAMRGEQAVRLAQALDRLPPDQREAVRLRYVEGWSLAQIAERLGRGITAVAGLVKRGMQALGKQLRENNHE